MSGLNRSLQAIFIFGLSIIVLISLKYIPLADSIYQISLCYVEFIPKFQINPISMTSFITLF